MNQLMEAGCLGALLMQFAISFQNNTENRAYILTLQRRFREYSLVLEVRHRSWADEAVLRDAGGTRYRFLQH